MEYYTNDELNMKGVRQTFFLSLAVLLVVAFLDIAPVLDKQIYFGHQLAFQIINLLVADFNISIITFVVTMVISNSLFRRDNWSVWLVGAFTVLSFASVVILKLRNNDLWLIVALICSILTMVSLLLFFARIIRYIKSNGRRLPF